MTSRVQVGQRPEIWQISKGHNNSINALKIEPPCFQTEYKVLVRTKKIWTDRAIFGRVRGQIVQVSTIVRGKKMSEKSKKIEKISRNRFF